MRSRVADAIESRLNIVLYIFKYQVMLCVCQLASAYTVQVLTINLPVVTNGMPNAL